MVAFTAPMLFVGKSAYSVVGLDEGVVDRNNVDVVVLDAVRGVSYAEALMK